jgi:putative transposase
MLKYRPTFPDRFGRKPPIPPTLPTTAWINQPKEEPLDTANP